jgi:hypothetical protein
MAEGGGGSWGRVMRLREGEEEEVVRAGWGRVNRLGGG